MSSTFILLVDGIIEWIIAKSSLDILYTKKSNKNSGVIIGLVIYIAVALSQLVFNNIFAYIILFYIGNVLWSFFLITLS